MESNGIVRLSDLTKSDVGKFVKVVGMLVGKQMALKKNNDPYLRTTIIDKHAVMEVPVWDMASIDIVNAINLGDVVLIQGAVSLYADALQVQPRSYQSVGNTRASEFVSKMEHSKAKRKAFGSILDHLSERYVNALKSLFAVSEDRSLSEAFEDDETDAVKKFTTSPCSVKHHMNIIGGLFEHHIGVVQNIKELAKLFCAEKPLLPGCTPADYGIDEGSDKPVATVCDEEMLIFLASIHDFDKIMEYTWDEYGIIAYRGDNLLKHDTMMLHTLSPHLQKAGFTYDECAKMYACLLTHHGEFAEFKPNRKDKYPIESLLLHYADYMDTKRDDLVAALKIEKDGDDNA